MSSLLSDDIDTDMNTGKMEIIDLLVALGVCQNIAKILICLHKYGPSKSVKLQQKCNLRQPDVSIAINRLNELGVLNTALTIRNGRDRPSHIYELSMSLRDAMMPFRNQANEKLAIIQSQLSRLSELVKLNSN